MPARRGDALDAEVGVGRALAQQLLGGAQHGRLDRPALGGGLGRGHAAHASLAPARADLTGCQTADRLTGHGPPAGPHHPGRRRHDQRRVASSRPSRSWTPQQLYRLWERQNWASHEIDLTQDRRDWEAMTRVERDQIAWGLSASSSARSAWRRSSPGSSWPTRTSTRRRSSRPSRSTRPATRSTSTASASRSSARRHLRGAPRAAPRHLNEAYFQLFDGQLVEAQPRLIDRPADVEAKVDFITTYHMVIEGTLALTGQHFQTKCLEQRGVLPGHLEGFRRISQDEHRHVAYGTWYLQRQARDPALARAHPGPSSCDAAGRGRRPRPARRTRSARTTSILGLLLPGDERVRLHAR